MFRIVNHKGQIKILNSLKKYFWSLAERFGGPFGGRPPQEIGGAFGEKRWEDGGGAFGVDGFGGSERRRFGGGGGGGGGIGRRIREGYDKWKRRRTMEAPPAGMVERRGQWMAAGGAQGKHIKY